MSVEDQVEAVEENVASITPDVSEDMLEAVENNSEQQEDNQEQLLTAISSLENLEKRLSELEQAIQTQDRIDQDFRENSESYLKTTFQDKIQSVADRFEISADEIENRLTDLENKFENKVESSIEQLDKIEGKSNELDETIATTEETIEELREWAEEIKGYHSLFLIDGERGISRKTEIERLVQAMRKQRDAISEYYDEFFGARVPIFIPFDKNLHDPEDAIENDDGTTVVKLYRREGGGKAELETAVANWNEERANFTKEHSEITSEAEKNYNTLKNKVESLLPGATSAGLASAFYDAQKMHATNSTRWLRLFISSLLLILLVAWLMNFKVTLGSWETTMESLLHIAPFEFPLLWFAIFASKRTKEHSRLQEEYLHKASVMQSFEGLRKQIHDYEGHDALDKLLNETVKSNIFNPSDTLEKKVNSDLPLEVISEELHKIKEECVSFNEATGKKIASLAQSITSSVNESLTRTNDDD